MEMINDGTHLKSTFRVLSSFSVIIWNHERREKAISMEKCQGIYDKATRKAGGFVTTV